MGAGAYILGLRAKIGHDLLLLPGVTVIVRRTGPSGDELLLARRVDTGAWTPITGGGDPGEDFDEIAIRECLEETGVTVAIDRLVSLETLPEIAFPNGDRCQYFDVCFLAHPVDGEAHVGDEENTDVRWFPVTALPPMNDRFQRQVRLALGDDDRPAFGAEARRYPMTTPDIADIPRGEYAYPGPLRDQLVAAILDGSKTTTTCLLAEYGPDEDPLDELGALEAVIDSSGEVVCVTRCTAVEIRRLGDVTLAHAIGEGEGYTSVAAWRAGHEEFWHSTEYVEDMGWIELDNDTPVVCFTSQIDARYPVVR